MSAIVLEDEIVHYEVLGRGRPLIFLHGWIGSWRYWIPSMQVCSYSFRTYALDLWGFGDSAKVASRYSLEEQTNLLSGFLDKMGIGKVALIGHGLGAVIGLLFAARNVDRVDRLMGIGFPLESTRVSPRVESATPGELAEWLLDHSASHEPAKSEVQKTDRLAIKISIEEIKEIDLLDVSLRVRTPCLWVYGQSDQAIDLPPLEYQSVMPDHVHQIIFEGSGHFPMLDDPTKFNRLIADFLNLDPGESPKNLQLKDEWRRRVR
jgi:pimeloyl-ACP methyl ester carboxylesterase